MFGKFKKTKYDSQNDIETKDSIDTYVTAKKKFKGPEMVLLGGLVLIMGGMFWLMSGGLSKHPKSSEKNNSKHKGISKEDSLPFVYANNMQEKKVTPVDKIVKKSKVSVADTMVEEVKDEVPFVYENSTNFSDEALIPPPSSYEKHNTLLAKKTNQAIQNMVENNDSIPLVEKQLISEPKEVIDDKKPVALNRPRVDVIKQKEEQNGAYVCHIVVDYNNMLGKEIMYYVKNKNTSKYIAAYTLSNWDESGVLVKKRFVASQVDVVERMVEVSKGKWIPALEFMTCTLVQEGMR